MEYGLGALLGCLNVMVDLAAEEQGVTLTSFNAMARGDLHPPKFLGKNMDVRACCETMEVEVEGDADTAKLEEVLGIAESDCPVFDNISNTTPVSIKIVKIG